MSQVTTWGGSRHIIKAGSLTGHYVGEALDTYQGSGDALATTLEGSRHTPRVACHRSLRGEALDTYQYLGEFHRTLRCEVLDTHQGSAFHRSLRGGGSRHIIKAEFHRSLRGGGSYRHIPRTGSFSGIYVGRF